MDNTSGTKIPLFVLKPMSPLGTISKFKKQSNNQFECSTVRICMLRVREKENRMREKEKETKSKDKNRLRKGTKIKMLLRLVPIKCF